jgi:hypothetical protein
MRGATIEEGKNMNHHITYPTNLQPFDLGGAQEVSIPQELSDCKWHNLCLTNHIALERFLKK